MTAVQTPVQPSSSERPDSKRAHPRDQAIARAVERCRAIATRELPAGGGDVVAAAIEACASGTRIYTATDGEAMLAMAPALFRASHLGLPIVMTVLSPPGRRDHGHTMALRDCGWVQLYPTDDQDAVDTHIQAFRIAEVLSLPVMVCMDTATRTRRADPLQVPSVDEIDAFLGRGEASEPPGPLSADQALDMHMEMRCIAHAKQGVALGTVRQVAGDFRAHFGRASGGALTTHRVCGARFALLGLGSAFEAITDAVDGISVHGTSVGALGLRLFRPFPTHDVAAALLHCESVVIVERAIAVGIGGIVSPDVRSALARLPVRTYTVIAGLGDRAISPHSLQRVLYQAAHGALDELSFLDVDREFVRSRRLGSSRGSEVPK
ncbi:MAG TPA: hypothetical protein VMF57_12280 [Solirubrobacteraceae bacterium]|nr:hypothetical protein [Solirubrobacteraceae bacterium]